MRFATLLLDNIATPCVRSNNNYIPLRTAGLDVPATMAALLEAGRAEMMRLASAAQTLGSDQRVPFETAVHLPVIPTPGKIVCLGLNFHAHAAEGGFTVPDYPAIFMRAPTSLVAHRASIIRPLVSEQLDYEVELAVIIGRRTRHVRKADALSSVAGYSVFNDGSIRAYQRKTSQWTMGKNFDATGAFGPELVSADELAPGANGLRISTRLNGQVVQDSNTSDMIFDVATTVSLLSECMTLDPGDVIIMGTPAGVGYARKPQLWMKEGDVCECEIEGIGILRNSIKNEVFS